MRRALPTLARALRDTILLGLGVRATVATVALLRARVTTGETGYSVTDDSLVYVTGAGYTYRWSTTSTAADNGTTVIVPDDAEANGRWLRTDSTVSEGYLLRVEFYDGTFDEVKIEQRLLGQRPCVVIHWDGSSNEVSSIVPGALYKYRPRFKLWGLSQNMRPRYEAQHGPTVEEEADADPGAQTIIGDLKALLAGEDLDTEGVDYCEIGDERTVAISLADRQFACELGLTVYATTHNPETDRVELDDPRAIDLTTEIASKGARTTENGEADYLGNAADRDNYRVNGGEVATGASLTQDIASGSFYVGGAAVAYAGQSKTFTASRDTYRDLADDGTLTFVERNNGDDEPPVTEDCLRVGMTVTDATSVTGDLFLCVTMDPITDGDGNVVVDQVPPE